MWFCEARGVLCVLASWCVAGALGHTVGISLVAWRVGRVPCVVVQADEPDATTVEDAEDAIDAIEPGPALAEALPELGLGKAHTRLRMGQLGLGWFFSRASAGVRASRWACLVRYDAAAH